MKLLEAMDRLMMAEISFSTTLLAIVVVLIIACIAIQESVDHAYRKGFDDGRREWVCRNKRNEENKKKMKTRWLD